MTDEDKDTSVRVAVRIRPQISRELIDMCRTCTQVTPGEPQVVLGTDKAFTFDYVFDMLSAQVDIYSTCVENLVDGALKGYNGTVLAYGQTGSGKTYTMGTGFERDIVESQEGIIPRAVRHLFSGIENCQSEHYSETGMSANTLEFTVAVQFMELYNEELIDLLDPFNKGKLYKIHEDPSGGISVAGATIKAITGPQDALRLLQQGALARTTASTQMNVQSSRSHALFTILIKRQRVMSPEESGMADGDLETLTSKFHFVDLAGSERLKRTGATGERAREGISINCGLLALGNVISALGDVSKRASHVPYRDSKLTRLLQDSLGGNSQTIMIACVSPSDRDFMETLNTLKYANRARNIKNRVLLNQDQSSRTISQLRREIAALQLEVLDFKQGKRNVDSDGNSGISDTFHENAMLLDDNKRLQQRLKAMQETINSLTDRNAALCSEQALAGWNSADSDKSVSDLISGYMSEIEKLKAKLIESDQLYQQLKKQMANQRTLMKANMSFNDIIMDNSLDVITQAKKEVEKEREILMSKSLSGIEENQNIENDSESDSDTESDDKSEMQAELCDLNSDIELKTKLIEQLELSQQRMQVMQQHYEEKLTVLNEKIHTTQNERDKMIANMSGMGASQAIPNDKMKKVRDEYEKKLNEMQRELRKLQSAQKEHARQQRELQAQEAQLRNLRNELGELKSSKIKLMRKINDENSRHKEAESRKAREIAQLRKEARKQLNQIKSLQAQGMAKDQVLKRKTEQITALRKGQQRNMSIKVAGRVPPKKSSNSLFSPRQAKIKWETLSRSIGRAARSKQAVVGLERELERLLEERENLSRDLLTIQKRQKFQESPYLASEEDSITANMNYIQENIEQIQHSIMELEDSKESTGDTSSLHTIFENIKSIEEAKFLLEKLCGATINQTCDAALTSTRLMEREALLQEVQQDSSMQQQLLQHILVSTPAVFHDTNAQQALMSSNNLTNSASSVASGNTVIVPFENSILAQHDVDREFIVNSIQSSGSSRSRSPSPSSVSNIAESDTLSNSSRTSKIRRRTAQPQDLLFGENTSANPSNLDDSMTRSFTQQPTENNKSFIPLSRVPSAPGSLKGLLPVPNSRQSLNNTSSPLLSRKQIETNPTVPLSPRVQRRPFPSKASPGLYKSHSGIRVRSARSKRAILFAKKRRLNFRDENETANTVPASPPSFRRMTSREDTGDVFSRLGAGTRDPSPGGCIKEFTGKSKNGAPLHCTHIVEGHNNSVLSIKVSGSTLYTAAADRTVKVWDLNRNVAVHCLSAHPGPVNGIEHDLKMNMLYSASGAFVRVWDLRSSNIRPIKTLCSSGSTLSGSAMLNAMQPGESHKNITALSLGASGNLYTAVSDKVRYWDMRTFSCLGKLSGGHQAAVMCVTAWEGPNNTDFVATGSKDHFVKVFEVPSVGGLINPLLHLKPPHYDGVQALVVDKEAIGVDAELFSGSRDTGIKRWDLRNGELIQTLNNAHKGWVSGMAFSGDVLLSCCRGGTIRLWNVKMCNLLSEMHTDSPINDIVACGNRVYTASNSGEVRIWRVSQTDFANLISNSSSNYSSNINKSFE